MKKVVSLCICMIVLVVLTIWASDADAYNFYSDATNDQGGCAQCHTGFRDNGDYVSQAEGFAEGFGWGTSLHNAHLNNTTVGNNCGNCHFGTGTAGRTVNLRSSANAADGVNAIACMGCHGRLEDANDFGPGPGWGAGLRQHHFNADVTICVSCHADANPATFTTASEDTSPPWYGSVLNTVTGTNLDPCNPSPGFPEDLSGDPANLGLDNDGDLAYDAADPDCQSQPDIGVNPLSLDFGTVTVGLSATRTTTISNAGDADLTVNSLTLTGSPDFALGTGAPATPFTVPSGQSVDVPVKYTPGEAGSDSGTLDIASDDPDEPTVSVSLAGTGQAPTGGQCQLSVSPQALDFGQAPVGNPVTLTTTITNNSADTDCNVTGLTPTGSADFAVNPGAPATPFIVPPLGTVDVPVDYTPSDVGQDSGTLDIASDDPVNPVISVSLAGEGVAAVCDLTVNPVILDFGTVDVGSTTTLSTTIGNAGTIDCTVNALTLTGSTDFALNPGAPGTPFTVAPGATVDVSVDYTPVDEGTDTGTLDIASNDPVEPVVSVTLQGAGSTRVCTVSPLILDFGSVDLGTTATRTTTVTNPAGSPSRCTVNSITFDNPEFTLSQNTPLVPPFNVWPGNAVNVLVDYKPVDLNTDNNTMTMNILDAGRTTVFDALVALTGAGAPPVLADIDVNPMILDFGGVSVGLTQTLTTTISNLGSSDLTVDGLSPTGSPDFTLGAGAPATPFTVPPLGSVDVPVNYAPLGVGGDSGTLEIVSNDPDEPVVNVDLTGTGEPTCNIGVNPLALDYGSVQVGTTVTLSTTISNTGTADCNVNTLSVTGSSDFTLNPTAPTAPFSVPPLGSVDVPVDYTPSGVGLDEAGLVIGSNDPLEPVLIVDLTGTGVSTTPDIDVNPLALDYGSVTVGTPVTLTTTISNVGGDDLTVNALNLTGSTDFDLNPAAPTVPFIVPPGQSVDVPVDYTPSDVGPDSGTLDIASDDPDEPVVSVALTGTGVPPAGQCDIDVNPLALDFGTVGEGQTATLQTTIGNTGDADCTIDSLTLTGSLDFTLNPGAPGTPFTVAPGATVDVPVDYTPSDVGDDSGTLEIGSDDPDENPVSVSLAGNGGTVDLDIQRVRVPKKVRTGEQVQPTLTIENNGVDGGTQTRPATVVGVQNSAEVFRQTQDVAASAGRSTYNFGPYTTTAAGDITWTATIADDNPDVDQATAVTTVK